MAERAARFYLLLGELARTTDHRAEVFLAHKDALLAHMREFHSELLRYSPRLHDATLAVEATGVERLLELAAEADDRLVPNAGSAAGRLAAALVRAGGVVRGTRARPRRPTGCSRPRSRRSATSWRCCAGSPRPGAAE